VDLGFEGIDGTGGNKDNRERVIASVFFVFSVCEGATMHPLFPQASGLTHDVIGAAIEVHKDKGPGLLESIYEWCLTMELELRGHRAQNQDETVVRYISAPFPLFALPKIQSGQCSCLMAKPVHEDSNSNPISSFPTIFHPQSFTRLHRAGKKLEVKHASLSGEITARMIFMPQGEAPS
jgi:hypothetical protein